MKAVKIRVEGRVQNVGYRRFVLEAARAAGVAGTVKNERDGSASLFAQGDPGRLMKFEKEIARASSPMEVSRVEKVPAKPRPRLKYFEILSRGLAEEVQEGFGAMQSELRDYRKEFRGFAEGTGKNFGTLGDKLDGFATKTMPMACGSRRIRGADEAFYGHRGQIVSRVDES